MQKLLTFFSKNISVYAIFNDQSFNDTLTNYIVSFEQLGPGCLFSSNYNRTPMAQTSFGPWQCVLDMACSSHCELIIALGQLRTNKDYVGDVFSIGYKILVC